MERAFLGCLEDVQQKLALKTLLDGLFECDLKYTLQLHDPQSIEEAVMLMEGWDRASKEAGVPVRLLGRLMERGPRGFMYWYSCFKRFWSK